MARLFQARFGKVALGLVKNLVKVRINMYSQLTVKIKGITPLLMHNGRGADPMHPLNKVIKPLTSKRAKTEEDMALIASLEWLKSLYTTDSGNCSVVNGELQIEGFGAPCIPGELIEGMIVSAAKKQKMGQQAKAAIICDGDWLLKYDGPKTIASLHDDFNFRDTRQVDVQGRSISRCRPVFRKWELECKIDYLPSVIDENTIKQLLNVGGMLCGIGDYRPKYGRFEVV